VARQQGADEQQNCIVAFAEARNLDGMDEVDERHNGEAAKGGTGTA
jgi:hypothetical protein